MVEDPQKLRANCKTSPATEIILRIDDREEFLPVTALVQSGYQPLSNYTKTHSPRQSLSLSLPIRP